MNKEELIGATYKKANAKEPAFTKAEVETVINAFLETVMESVSTGETVRIIGFGTFSKKFRKGRMGRDPKSGKSIEIPDKNVPRFDPGKKFKSSVA